MSNIDTKKEIKETNLLNSALKLFTEKGIHDTSVSEITKDAGVAKGTFYLYFKDKYELQDYLIIKKSKGLFDEAIKSLQKTEISHFEDKIIYIIDYIISKLSKNKLLLKLISKNLAWGVYHEKITDFFDKDSLGLQELFIKEIQNNNLPIKYPEMKLYMIIELVSGTIFSSILNNKPLPIDELKPLLYDQIKAMLK